MPSAPPISTIERVIKKVMIAVALASLLIGCGLQPPSFTPQDLDALKSVHDQFCPDGKTTVTYLANDASKSVDQTVFVERRMPAVRTEITRAAVCNDTVTVADFAKSSSAVHVLYAGNPGPSGATLESRLRKVPAVVESTLTTIRAKHDAGSDQMSRAGTDLRAPFRAAADYFAQVPSPDRRRVVILTDGADGTNRAAAVAKLPVDTEVLIAGVGVADRRDARPDEARVQAATAHLKGLCEAASAAHCLIVSDYSATEEGSQ